MKKVTQSLLVWDVQAELLQKAAAKRCHGNVSEYVREYVFPLIAKDMGVPNPIVPRTDPGRPTSRSGTHAIDLTTLAKAIVDELDKRTTPAKTG